MGGGVKAVVAFSSLYIIYTLFFFYRYSYCLVPSLLLGNVIGSNRCQKVSSDKLYGNLIFKRLNGSIHIHNIERKSKI